MTTKKVSEIAPYENNPRKISRDELAELKRDLEDLGDLSGIVHELNSNQIISGNQRSVIFDESLITITETLKAQTKQGTVARGFIEYEGEQFSYRQVRWSPELSERANIRANKAGGSWDWDRLIEYIPIDRLLDYGFEEKEIPNLEIQPTDEIIPIAAADQTHLATCPKCGFEFKT